MREHDYIIIGGGVAGLAVGCELSKYGSVVLLEMESQPGMHTSGRSASVFVDAYGNEVVQRLSAASRSFMEEPGEFSPTSLLKPIGGMMVADRALAPEARVLFESLAPSFPDWRVLSVDEAVATVPFLSPDWVGAAVLDPRTASIDVHALMQGFARGMRARGGMLMTNQRVGELSPDGAGWRVRTDTDTFRARAVVNAAGAWADEIARRAGVPPVGLVPKRRTVVTFDPPDGLDASAWPIVADLAETFYFKPESGRLLASPSDQTPVEPCDPAPEEIDVAIAMDRLERVSGRSIRRIHHKWAGLRSFVADESPVLGADPVAPGFIWCAALGGFGFQTSPAYAGIVAAAAARVSPPGDQGYGGLTEADYGPRRDRIGAN